MHGTLRFGDNIIMVSDVFKGHDVSVNGNIHLSVDITEKEQIDTVFDKMAKGGKITMPLQDTF